MKKLTQTLTLQMVARLSGKPCMLVCFDCEDLDEIQKAAPYIDPSTDAQFIVEGGGVIICDDDAEMDRLYQSTVGDDGPTKTNPYNGPQRVYALTCSANGHPMNENT